MLLNYFSYKFASKNHFTGTGKHDLNVLTKCDIQIKRFEEFSNIKFAVEYLWLDMPRTMKKVELLKRAAKKRTDI